MRCAAGSAPASGSWPRWPTAFKRSAAASVCSASKRCGNWTGETGAGVCSVQTCFYLLGRLYLQKVPTPQLCPTCHTPHQLADMLEQKNPDGVLDFFCSHRCMKVHKVQTVSGTVIRLEVNKIKAQILFIFFYHLDHIFKIKHHFKMAPLETCFSSLTDVFTPLNKTAE